MADPYATLGVSKSATEADIKKAYRKLAKELHPDTNKDNPKAAERFSRVTQAYDLLSDKDKRAQFDRGEIDGDGNPSSPFGGFGGQGPFGGGGGRGPFGGAGGTGGGFSTDNIDLGDIFEGIFGGRSRGGGGGFSGFPGGGRQAPQPKGANIAYRLQVPFEDAAASKPQRITLADGKAIDLKLPAGVENGTQMKLAGKGEVGPGGAGDAIVTIEIVPHRFFEREGKDVRLHLPITLSEAVKGASVKVPTVEGPVMLKVPAGATSGQTLRLKGRGFATKSGGRGDQLVTLQVDLPRDDQALAAFVETWRDERNPRIALGV